jgi:hypothetical protein
MPDEYPAYKNGEASPLLFTQTLPWSDREAKAGLRGKIDFGESAKAAAAEYLQTREQILNIFLNIPEMPPTMNGGHYLTKGHVILCLLYSKTSLMSRNILEPRKIRFLAANSPWLHGRSALSTLAFWVDHKPPRNASGFRKQAVPVQVCSF